MTDKGLELIARFEGCKLEPYVCPAGKITIGYGSTRYADGTPVQITDDPITQEQAKLLLKITAAKFEARVRALFGDMPQNKIEALTSLAYNIGAARLDKSTLAKRIRENAPKEDIKKAWLMFTMATVKGVKKKLWGLERRRKAEISHYFAPAE